MESETAVNSAMAAWSVVMLTATLTVYYRCLGATPSGALDAGGFDLAMPSERAPELRDAAASITAPAPLSPATGQPAPPPDSLAMHRGSLRDPLPPSESSGGANPSEALDAANRVARNYEADFRELLARHRAKSPAIGRMVADWKKHAELNRLRERYRADHDFVSLVRGAMKSRNHWRIITQYGTSPEFRAMSLEAFGSVTPELSAALGVAMESSGKRDAVAATLAGALGLPPALFAGPKAVGPALAAATLLKDAEALAKRSPGPWSDPPRAGGPR